MAVAAIMASSVMVSDLLCMRRAHSLKAGASIGKTPKEASTLSSHASKLLRLGRILLTGDLDPRLYLPNRDGRHEELLRRHIVDPLQDGTVRTGTAQFGNHVGVQEVHGPIPQPRLFGGDAVGEAA